MDGDWSTPDLVAVVRLAVRNLEQVDGSNRLLTSFRRLADFIEHRRRRNTQTGSRRNIAYHYDLGNDFYRLFLDRSLAYSCAYYESAEDTLEQAQMSKFDRICRKLQLGPRDHVLEIGTGWGGFAAYAAETYGCRVTTTTISRQQHDYAREVFSRSRAGDASSCCSKTTATCADSMTRSSASKCSKPWVTSTTTTTSPPVIACSNRTAACCCRPSPSWKKSFSNTASKATGSRSTSFPEPSWLQSSRFNDRWLRSTRMQLFHSEDIGTHYALTLHEWRRRFLDRLPEVRHLGFDERFVRMWDYYLAYCEGAFREGYISDVQLVLVDRSINALQRQGYARRRTTTAHAAR